MLFMGDFNYPEIDWKHHTTPSEMNNPASVYMEAVRDCFLTQNATEPINCKADQKANMLGLIMTNKENVIDQIIYHSSVGQNHHSCLKFLFKYYQFGKYPKIEKLKFDKGDNNSMRGNVQSVDGNLS